MGQNFSHYTVVVFPLPFCPSGPHHGFRALGVTDIHLIESCILEGHLTADYGLHYLGGATTSFGRCFPQDQMWL
jgi:hypothetical protein